LYRFIGLIGLFLSLTIAFSSAAETAGGQQALPFTLSWTSGVCPKCQTAQSLSEVQFVSPTEAWGIGYVPPGEIGAGAGDSPWFIHAMGERPGRNCRAAISITTLLAFRFPAGNKAGS